MARNDQIVRILSVARALASSRRGVSLKELATREGWNWRTVYRDVQALEAAGFPIETVDGRHRLPADWSMPNLPGIEPDEILAFYAVRALAGTWRTTAVGKPLVATQPAGLDVQPWGGPANRSPGANHC